MRQLISGLDLVHTVTGSEYLRVIEHGIVVSVHSVRYIMLRTYRTIMQHGALTAIMEQTR
jgi:hypothetical protein